MKKILVVAGFALGFLVVGCNSRNAVVKHEMPDSVKNIIQEHYYMVQTIHEATAILDSIDQLKKSTSLPVEGYQNNIAARLQAISHYVIASEKKIAHIEKQLKISRNEADAYLMMVDALKSEVQIRDEELRVLGDSIVKVNAVSSTQTITRRGI